MQSLPVGFRVVRLHADESHHQVSLFEVRKPVAVNSTAPGMLGAPRVPDSPQVEITVGITAEQFSKMHIGQVFELVPGEAVLGQQIGCGQLGALAGLGNPHLTTALR